MKLRWILSLFFWIPISLLGSELVLGKLEIPDDCAPRIASGGQVILRTSYIPGDGKNERQTGVTYREFPLDGMPYESHPLVHLGRLIAAMGHAIDEARQAHLEHRLARLPDDWEAYAREHYLPPSEIPMILPPESVAPSLAAIEAPVHEIYRGFEPAVVKGFTVRDSQREPSAASLNQQNGARLRAIATFLEPRARRHGFINDDAEDKDSTRIKEIFETALELAANIEKSSAGYDYGLLERGGLEALAVPSFGVTRSMSAPVAKSASPTLGLGGLQGWKGFRDEVKQGRIPEEFPRDAYNRGFNFMPPPASRAKKLVDPHLPLYVDPASGEVTTLFGFDTTATATTYADRRKNVVFLVDVSGSMGERDYRANGRQSVRSRIEAAKEYILGSLKFFGPRDVVSIHIFGNHAREFSSPMRMTVKNKALLAERLAGLEHQNEATDLVGGLNGGYQAALNGIAQLNNADCLSTLVVLTDLKASERFGGSESHVEAAAQKNMNQVGLVVVGLGQKFPEKLAQVVSAAEGIAIHILSGDDMVEGVDRFPRLIIPIATQVYLTAQLDAQGYTTELKFLEGFNIDPAKKPGSIYIPKLYLVETTVETAGGPLSTYVLMPAGVTPR